MTTRHLTIRTRLTLLYGGLVMLAGAALLAMVLVLLDRVIATQPIVLDEVYANLLATGGVEDGAGSEAAQAKLKQQTDAQAQAIRADLRRRTLTPLVRPSIVGLGVFGLAGFVAVWFVSGRALRPVRTMTVTARQVAAGQLDVRIGLAGPRDELRELADAFDAMLDRLHRAFENQRAFVGNASHELRTPVTITRTLLDVALGDPDAPPELVEVGSRLLAVNARQGQLIDALLTLARSTEGMRELRPVDLAAVAHGVVERYGVAATSRGIVIEVAAPESVTVVGDEVLLEQLVENLVQNAIRYNLEAGGRVSVHAEGGSRAVLRVVNTGPVVDPAFVPTLFEPFRRAVERVDSGQGFGLGLSIVKSVTDAHGGTVAAIANPGGGLSVEVTLPLARVPASAGS